MNGRRCREADFLAGGVIAEGEGQHDAEPEDGANDDKVGALGAVARVHEEEETSVALMEAMPNAMTMFHLP
jgi:hypothetical protein